MIWCIATMICTCLVADSNQQFFYLYDFFRNPCCFLQASTASTDRQLNAEGTDAGPVLAGAIGLCQVMKASGQELSQCPVVALLDWVLTGG